MSQIKIDRTLAQKIVEAVNEVCDCPVNFINKKGLIVASTDINRMDTFHEAGYLAIKSAKSVIVENDERYEGAKIGVNYPIYINNEPVAVIGITGEPSKIKQFGFLATKITEVFIKEQQISQLNESYKQQMNYVIRYYIYNQVENEEYIRKILEELQINMKEEYAVMLLKLNKQDSTNQLTSIEKQIFQLFESLEMSLNTYIYPNEFIGFIDKKNYLVAERLVSELCNKKLDIVKIGVGNFMPLKRLYKSYEMSKVAISYVEKKNENYCFFEELNIEMIIGSLNNEIKKQYANKILDPLEDKEKELLEIYFENNMNLKKTAENLFLHVNTVQYQLDKIAEKVKLNPRIFKEAVSLYMAILIE